MQKGSVLVGASGQQNRNSAKTAVAMDDDIFSVRNNQLLFGVQNLLWIGHE